MIFCVLIFYLYLFDRIGFSKFLFIIYLVHCCELYNYVYLEKTGRGFRLVQLPHFPQISVGDYVKGFEKYVAEGFPNTN